MKILVSACLMGENCKYNGGNNYSEKLHKFIKGHEVIMVCPEVKGGLPTPRLPSEIVDDRVVNSGGVDVTNEFVMGATKALLDFMGYVFFFWSREDGEPPHVHVCKGAPSKVSYLTLTF